MSEASERPKGSERSWWSRMPMYARVMLGVVVGGIIGFSCGTRTFSMPITEKIAVECSTADLGALAEIFIQALTALAIPLIFFAILDAFVQTDISGRQGAKMFLICGVNVFVAFAIGLVIINMWKPGLSWNGKLEQLSPTVKDSAGASAITKKPDDSSKKSTDQASTKEPSLAPIQMLRSYVPRAILQPFTENMVLTVAVMAILIGAAMRSLRSERRTELSEPVQVFEKFVVASYQIVLKILLWMIELAPFAICMAVASVIGKTGSDIFRLVGVFFVTILAALTFHAFVYYTLSAWLIGRKSPSQFFREGISAIITGFSINSSLATAPMTLDALRRMHVSESSARLSACVGTNFNNDGITLYEAMTALFIAQASGMPLSLADQITVLIASLAGSIGIAGIPNSGLIILALVLKAARLPDVTIELALPIVYSIDFILARLRSAVNVMGDMQVAILLDAKWK